MIDREHVTDALRFWEIARLPYNLILAAIVAGAMWLGEQDLRGWLELAPVFIGLAVLANILYCAAYPVDLLVQASAFRPLWRPLRWALWALGTLFAAMLAATSMLGLGAFGAD
jgi:hypothetical protein